MSEALKGKNFVLGITGSIAAYKAATLIRLLVKEGAKVQVVITPAGKEFITPLTLSTLSQNPVISEFFSGRDGTWNSHVDLGQWADAMVIAPCTASTLGKLAGGVADNMLATTYFAMKAPVFIAPAMDLDMYSHPVTQRNLEYLRSIGNIIIEPGSGFLASGLEGKGRMEEPEKILISLEEYFQGKQDLSKKKILITAGPTYEHIDPVRFIGNNSTGKMGFALADECCARGAEVTLIAGPVSVETTHKEIKRIDVTTAEEMYREAVKAFPHSDAAILCAAVADFTPAVTAESKIKRKGTMELTLVPTKDIAAALGEMKRQDQKLVGFALETDSEEVNAKSKLERKNLDFIVLNSLRDKGAGFGYDTNKVTLIDRKGQETFPLKSKKSVAKDIVDRLAKLLMCLLLMLPTTAIKAQELKATVTLNTSKVSGTDRDVFNSLQNALRDFINQTVWTEYQFEEAERIACSFNVLVNKYSADDGAFECELTVQSNRPVYNSSYNTTVFNYRDINFNFNYTEQDRLEFTPTSINNNLTAVIAFYCYLMIGLDFDTMSEKGGTEILQTALNIVNNAQSLGAGWRSFDNNQNRYALIGDYMNGSLESFRLLLYQYHRKGLDDMAQNAERGRGTITESLELLKQTKQAKSTSVLPVLFTEIKHDELLNIYSQGLAKQKESVASLLADINPSMSEDWDRLKE